MINKLIKIEQLIWNIIVRNNNIILILYIALIAYLSTIPGIVVEDSLSNAVYLWVPPSLQSFGHFIVYAGLAVLFHIFFIKQKHKEKSAMLFSLIITSFLGIFFELVQQYIPGRDAIISDAIINTIGTIFGLWYIGKRQCFFK